MLKLDAVERLETKRVIKMFGTETITSDLEQQKRQQIVVGVELWIRNGGGAVQLLASNSFQFSIARSIAFVNEAQEIMTWNRE